MGRRDLSEYVHINPRAWSARGRVWTYQANLYRTCYICYVTLLALQKMPNLPFTVLSLYIMTCAVYGYGFFNLMFL